MAPGGLENKVINYFLIIYCWMLIYLGVHVCILFLNWPPTQSLSADKWVRTNKWLGKCWFLSIFLIINGFYQIPNWILNLDITSCIILQTGIWARPHSTTWWEFWKVPTLLAILGLWHLRHQRTVPNSVWDCSKWWVDCVCSSSVMVDESYFAILLTGQHFWSANQPHQYHSQCFDIFYK